MTAGCPGPETATQMKIITVMHDVFVLIFQHFVLINVIEDGFS